MSLTQRVGINATLRSATKRNGPFGYRQYTIIYAIDAPGIGLIKFGQTGDIKRRFRGIANMAPCPLVLLGYVWMPIDTEPSIFEFLADDRSHGEWFNKTDRTRSIAALIAAKMDIRLAEEIGLAHLITEHLPSGVSWGAR